ncbi:MAG: right-handed parallel beta-helix repeat-containing protein [Candidatus Hodarchaeota archaeon]
MKSKKNVPIFLFFLVLTSLTLSQVSDTSNSSERIANLDSVPLNSQIQAEFYVSPSGNDSDNGSLNYPFKTLFKAQDVVRNNISGGMSGDVIVYLMDGTYWLNQTFNLNQSDSGNNGHEVIYQNYNNSYPTVSGGQTISGWVDLGDGLWSAPCPVDDFRQLYVNGKRATRARGDVSSITQTDGDGHRTDNENMHLWRNINQIEMVYKGYWTLPRIRIDRFNWFDDTQFFMQQPAYSYSRTKSDSSHLEPVWIENAFELLDEKGEWYLDRSIDTLYYRPFQGEDMGIAEVVAPVLEELVKVEGSWADKVHNLKFQGLEFSHGSWLRPNVYSVCFPDSQANVFRIYEDGRMTSEMSPGNVICKFVENITFEGCNFTKLGTAGIHFQVGVTHSNIIGCVFNDISGSGIQVGNTTFQNGPLNNGTVKDINIMNNYVVNCSQEYMGGCGIIVFFAQNVRIEHNAISNHPYTGISVGWRWTNDTTIVRNNSIKYNHIYGIMNYLEDGGGIYTLGNQSGTNVSYNYIHDSGWNGLYPDQGSVEMVWSNNVVHDCYNTFLDHCLSDWTLNDVINNYLDRYPRYTGDLWPSYRDADQIWGKRPGDPGFPDFIANQAGLEAPYKYLIPENEYYYKYHEFSTEQPFSNPALLWIFFGVLGFLGVVGSYMIFKKKEVKRDD